MQWCDLFNVNHEPSFEDIKQFIGKGEPLWSELLSYIEKAYQVKPKTTYSKCSAQPGWNVKYQKGSKSLCTLYPMEGYFITLVVVGAKEEEETEMALGTFTPFVQGLYLKTAFSCGGRWLMIKVDDKLVLDDVKSLIAIRVKPKRC
ncbi:MULTISPECIES: DUF3788 domain-containing protein [Dehalobacter]|jgi:hypothetical protein|uniref:DUF3788 family protein n=2 Tax=Dehalobacter restrictus TaxID=55583 RepID=A0A857DHJ6_9FIRM|nr:MULTISPECIES: DUF3788 domain-containing protein [Dehalobacter]AHF10228.1 hypothetical protein DEHRE_09155 [Dehalobacter restrictus DSM 9455]MCG1025652.1 DUF3788 domain-containing protein [Dehalobacter sp.]MDJ0306259.1 DUF3788 domain-containing protein [Dehalobacter sp.]OCZ51462.1 hypothetical protein A7D23_12590 [Dehalobacter sp. TeCB1]QHA00820.1 DUF3788 family protein [Dehalobacter restrictus]